MPSYIGELDGSKIEVEIASPAVLWHMATLVVDGVRADTANAFLGTVNLRSAQPRPFRVRTRFGWFGPKTPVLVDGSTQTSLSKVD